MSENEKVIILYDSVITLLYNDQLSNRPYLVRLNNRYNELYETRCSREDLLALVESVLTFVDNTK